MPDLGNEEADAAQGAGSTSTNDAHPAQPVGSMMPDPLGLRRFLTRVGLGAEPGFPLWLVPGLADLERRAAAGTVRRCRHRTEQPTFLTFRPGRLFCPHCGDREFVRSAIAGQKLTCDACAGPSVDVSVIAVMAGGVSVIFSACADCAPNTVVTL